MQEKHLNDSLSQENSVTGGLRGALFRRKWTPQKNEQNRVSGGPPHAFPPKMAPQKDEQNLVTGGPRRARFRENGPPKKFAKIWSPGAPRRAKFKKMYFFEISKNFVQVTKMPNFGVKK